MKSLLESGKYIVAVSGGVDSVVLLNMISQDKNLELIVAHFDHGIREESGQDLDFVAHLAAEMKLEFVAKQEKLGTEASEALARDRRYRFLKSTLKKYKARAIVTAHHQDDLIETAIINTIRGTKRRGLISLKSTDSIKRPLLNTTKHEILSYALKHKLQWREDVTNSQPNYLRNRIRRDIKDSLTPEKRRKIVKLLTEINILDDEIQKIVEQYLKESHTSLKKSKINKLYLGEAYEIVAGWLNKNKITFDQDCIKRVVIGARTLQNNSQIDLTGGYYCQIVKDEIVIKCR